MEVQNSGGGTTSPGKPLQGLIKSHNSTQASMASNIGLCAIADAAKEMGYHNAISNASDVYSANSFQPPMTIGTVQASPLTMANVYATMGANGVECTPIAITKVTDRSGSKVKVPSANCHQAIDPDIAQTVSYALNQGVVQPGGEASTTQLDNNRKTFAKTGTNENTVMTTAGFVPNQVAAFVAVADAQDPINNTFDNKTINGVYRRPVRHVHRNAGVEAVHEHVSCRHQRADRQRLRKGCRQVHGFEGCHQNIQPVPIPAPAEQSAAKPAAKPAADRPRPAAAIAATACRAAK